jgi:hypothetical protein
MQMKRINEQNYQIKQIEPKSRGLRSFYLCNILLKCKTPKFAVFRRFDGLLYKNSANVPMKENTRLKQLKISRRLKTFHNVNKM